MRHLLDVNVIVGVLRADSELHAAARAWLRGTTGAVVALPETLAAAVRVLTNDRIWAQVPTVDEATASVSDLVDGAQISITGSSPGAWPAFTAFVASGQLTHRDVPDALLAAQARSMDAELVTFDRGFRDYPGLRVQIL
ncbi:MAG: PIN domain-containing protein [Actinomycetales bacterium]|nr:PIN domain-containing protein [Actinomycetales bacterium]